MQLPAEELGKWERIERKIGGELRSLQSTRSEVLLPLAARRIVVRQCDTVGAVADPVHGAQSCVIEGIFAQVVFQDDVGTRNACGFAQELPDVGGVVEHINEEANVERLIGKRELRAIERAAWHLARWPRNHFHTFDGQIGPALGEQASDGAVSTADIEDSASFRWNQRRQGIRKHARAAAEDEGPVAAGYPGERPRRWRGSHRIGSACKFFHIP